MNSRNVLNSFLDVFCCKVGVNYSFNSELKNQRWCGEKKKYKEAIMLLLVKCYDNKKVKSPRFSSIGKPPCG